MTNPRQYLIRMAIFLMVVVAVVIGLYQGLEHAFTNNVGLNSVTLSVLLLGIVLNFRQVVMLGREALWVDDFRKGAPTISTTAPRLLGPLAAMLGERRDRFNLSPLALRSVLDGLAARLDESRELARYFIGLMIFLGLLGTFWGLSQTVGSLGEVIRNLSISSDDVNSAFQGLKQGLDAPLSGMGTAFSTSLIGLSGSLILGFLDLQAGQAQNAFYNDLEEWLSTQTKLGSSVGAGEGSDQPIPAYIRALLEQTADSLDNLQRTLARGEEGRISSNANMRLLTDRLSTLADQMKTEQSLMLKLAENQLEMRPIMMKLAEGPTSAGIDDTSRNHIRNIDVSLGRMIDEMSHGRDEVIREIRSEFKLLARTIAVLADEDSTPVRLGRPEL
ncbi:MAG TPA: flagellar motor protein MotA [Patescibacteria group bacterium]|nr:flagellar motor protein MotA [Patescibacteria group bacterium]